MLAAVGAADGIGLISLGRDLGIEHLVSLHIDTSAALGHIEQRGAGRVWHLEVGSFWIQEQQLERIFEMLKVPGLGRLADLATKHLNRERNMCMSISLLTALSQDVRRRQQRIYTCYAHPAGKRNL